jgi:hypothetical protein
METVFANVDYSGAKNLCFICPISFCLGEIALIVYGKATIIPFAILSIR